MARSYSEPVARPPQRGTGQGGGEGGGNNPKRDRLAEVGRGSTLNLAGAAISAVAGVLTTVLVARHFSRPVAGAFFTATSAFVIVRSVASIGANTGVTYFVARLRSLGEERRLPTIMRAAIIPVVVASLLAAAAMWLFAAPLANLLLSGRQAHGAVTPAQVSDALRALAVVVPASALLTVFIGATRGYHDMRPTNVVSQLGLAVGQIIGVLAAVFVGSAALLAPLWAAPFVPCAIAAWLWLRHIQRKPRAKGGLLAAVPPEIAALMALATPSLSSHGGPRTKKRAGSRVSNRRLANANPRGFWTFSIPRGIANTAQNILARIDIVLVASMKGVAAAAVYTAATRFLAVGQLGGVAINNAAQPRFTELFTAGDRRGANDIYQATTAWLVLLLWPLFLLAVVYGPQVLLVFGRSYSAGTTVIVILGIAALFATACGQVDMVLITSGRSSWSLANGLLAVGVNVGIDLLLIPKYGIIGAAIGWAVAMVLTNVMPLLQLAAVYRLHPLGRGTVIACLLTGLSFGIVPLAARAVLGNTPLALVAGIAAGCVVQAIGLWRFRGALRLSAMPGASAIIRRLSRR
jgi:O-antigen/teichoic acid export membrane protein